MPITLGRCKVMAICGFDSQKYLKSAAYSNSSTTTIGLTETLSTSGHFCTWIFLIWSHIMLKYGSVMTVQNATELGLSLPFSKRVISLFDSRTRSQVSLRVCLH